MLIHSRPKSTPPRNPTGSKLFQAFLFFWFLTHCAGSPPPELLPPSESDLDLLQTVQLCQSKEDVEKSGLKTAVQESDWGGGKEVFQEVQTPKKHGQWFMFNEDRILVGVINVFPQGLSLETYPKLRHTLAQLPPAREFFFHSSQLLDGQAPESGTLYRTGEATTTHQYFLRHGQGQQDRLVMAVFVLDPYETILDGSHAKFLSYIDNPHAAPVTQNDRPATGDSMKTEKEFLALQQFARGEIALFASCGVKKPEIAVNAYQQAIQHGLADTKQLAEAHHRLGLAMRTLGRLSEAKTTLQHALSIQPHSAGILNSYGSVLAQMGDWATAIETYEKALALQPDNAHARFNLAEAYESLNPKRAIQEYETFLILAEDKPGEAAKVDMAKSRIKILQGGASR